MKERTIECQSKKHNCWHLENDPCPECYDRYAQAEKLKKKRELRKAVRRANQTHGLHDAINQYLHEHLKEGGRIY